MSDDTPTPSYEQELRRDWRLFAGLTFLFGFGFAIYNGVFQNFLREIVGAKALDLGILESMREIPGLLAALTAGTLMLLAQSRVASIGLAITGVGLIATAFTHRIGPLIAVSMFWSVGFHLYSTVSGGITLALAKGKEGGRHLGRMAGIGASATIFGLGTGLLLAWIFPKMPYDVYFVIGGISVLGSAALCRMLSHHAESHSELRFVIRREYSLYYLLIFLEGCRRQIFAIFASFALILVYGVPKQHMLALMFANALLISFTAPWIGRIVDKKGERGPLTFYAAGLIVVFIGWALIERKEVLYALFLLDNVLFSFGVGFTTYLNRIVRPNELRPCLAMGVTMNHIAAVTVPVGGALLWESTGDYQVPFLVGVGIATVSLIATLYLPTGPVPQHEPSQTVLEPAEAAA